MKVVSPQQMSNLESEAYREGASEYDYMEEAGSGIALVVHDFCEKYLFDKHVILLCGKGNNGGDAYVAGIHLLQLEYHVVAYQLFPLEVCSSLCSQSHLAFLNEGGIVKEVNTAKEISFPLNGVIVDGIFGTGFHGEVNEPIASILEKANRSQLPIIAIDIPSGLNGETGETSAACIIATETAFLGLPKRGFFLCEGWNNVGKLAHVDFGLSKTVIEKVESELVMLSPEMMRPLLPPIKRNRHKYQAGSVVGLAGSPQYPGAAILSSLAALTGGAGIVRLLCPEGMQHDLVSGPYELIRVSYDPDNAKEIIEMMNSANATFIGPGLGLTPKIRKLLHDVIPHLNKPCVIDADALTILAEDNIPFPNQTVLTPHAGELKRLLPIPSTPLDMPFLQQCQDYATKQNITLVLKGAPTFIFHPNEPTMVNPRGDPGMATAGSGDVLTGLIAALLAQGLAPKHAAALGVYLHGIAGEYAAFEMTSYCMIASDIINCFPDAFLWTIQK